MTTTGQSFLAASTRTAPQGFGRLLIRLWETHAKKGIGSEPAQRGRPVREDDPRYS